MTTLKSPGKGTSVAFLSGGVSAACTTLLFQPLDLVKTRMQVHTLALRSTPVYGYLWVFKKAKKKKPIPLWNGWCLSTGFMSYLVYVHLCVCDGSCLSFVSVFVQGCGYWWKYCWHARNFQHCHKKRKLHCTVERHLTCTQHFQYVLIIVDP